MKPISQVDLEVLKSIKNRTRRGLTQEQAVQLYNLYTKYVNNQVTTCFSCGDKDAKQYLETLEQLYMQPKKPTILDADFKLPMNIDYANRGLCIYCGAKDGLIETQVVGIDPNIKLKACKTKCGYTQTK